MEQAINTATTCEDTMSMRSREAVQIDVVDPPEVVTNPGADGEDRAPVAPAAGGGTSGFTNHCNQATAWDCLAGQGELISELGDFLKSLDESPDLRAAATLRALSRVREELERVPESAQLSDPVQLRLQDVVLVARQLMSRLR